jgi:glutamate racemase
MPGTEGTRIAFYDSGVGGLPYFKRTRELLPGAAFHYLADSLHFPLGEKPRDQVAPLVRESVGRLMEASRPDIVVIACNTASVMALESLRKEWPGTLFVGTVPAVKPAAAATKTGKVAVLGTSRLVESAYMRDLVKKFAGKNEVLLVARGEWVEFVERRWLGSGPSERLEAIKPPVDALLGAGVDVMVLSCTHFLYLAEDIRSYSGERASVIDSSDGVSRRVADLARDFLAKDGLVGTSTLWTTAPTPSMPAFAEHFGLDYGGLLP